MGDDKSGPSASGKAAGAAGIAAGLAGIAQLLADPPGWWRWVAILGGAGAVYLLFSLLARRTAPSPERRRRAEERWLDPRRPGRAQLLTEGSSEAGFFAFMVVFSAVLAALAMAMARRSERRARARGPWEPGRAIRPARSLAARLGPRSWPGW